MRQAFSETLPAARSVAGGRDAGDEIIPVPRESMDGAGQIDPGHELTGRELEVLLLAARGLGNKRIGEDLHLSETMVKRYLSNVYEKLGVHSRGEAVGRAVSEGWISSRDISRTAD